MIKNAEVVDRMIEHFKVCPDNRLTWGHTDCAAGLLREWRYAESISAADLGTFFQIPYIDAIGLFYTYTGDLDREVLSINTRPPEERREIIIRCLEHFKATGKAKWSVH